MCQHLDRSFGADFRVLDVELYAVHRVLEVDVRAPTGQRTYRTVRLQFVVDHNSQSKITQKRLLRHYYLECQLLF